MKLIESIKWMLPLAMLLAGCDLHQVDQDPPVALTMSSSTVTVSNLDASKGMEVYFYVANQRDSMRFGNEVIPANGNSKYGFLSLKGGWTFKPGDRGFVKVVRWPNGRKLCFEITSDTEYRTWFSAIDVPEVDVTAARLAREREERLAAMQAQCTRMCDFGERLFVLLNGSTNFATKVNSHWPAVAATRSERLKALKDSVSAKWFKEKAEASAEGQKFASAAGYVDMLLGLNATEDTNSTAVVSADDVKLLLENAEQGKETDSAKVLWHVLGDLPNAISPKVPVLISANFPCEQLLAHWDGEGMTNVVHLACRGPLKDEAVVLVRADGTASAIPAGDVTLAEIYGGSFNTCTNGYNAELHYLTPSGVQVVK